MHKGFSFFFGHSPKKNVKKDTPFSYYKSHRHDKKTETVLAFVRHCDYKHIFDIDEWQCVPRSSTQGRNIALHRLNKYKEIPLKPAHVWGFLQFQDNCWFNALLMCLLFSDRMRILMNSLRHKWITYKGDDEKKKKLYHIFEYLMEIPHYNEELINEIDSNVILHKLHKYDKKIFQHPGYEGGNGILYCKNMLNFLGLSRYMEIRIIYVEEDDDIYVEIDGYVKNREHKDSDIEAILNNNISYQHRHAQIVAVYIDVPQRFYFPEKLMEDYKLDCMYITNYKNLVSDDHHAIAGITMNKHLYLYDGQRAVFQHSLKSYNWKKGRTGMSASSFVMSYDKRGVLRYDISKSSRVAFYVLDE